MRKPEGVKPLDPHVPPIHHQYSPRPSALHNLSGKEDLETDEVVNISSITEKVSFFTASFGLEIKGNIHSQLQLSE